MNILVTGATGRIGSRLVPRLLQQGDSVRILVRNPEKASLTEALGVEIVKGDLLQPETLLQAVDHIDGVIHLAAFFRGATPEETHAVNLEGTLALAHASLQAGVSRFVFSSTNLVYGPGNDDQIFRESETPHPATPYPITKYAAEEALMDLYRRQGLGLRILRFAFVYGEGDPHLSEGLRWFRKWNPMQRIHLVHHADVGQAVRLATDVHGVDGRIYNVADNEPITVNEILRLYGEQPEAVAESSPLDPAWHQIVDTAKIRRELKFNPLYPSLHDTARTNAL